MKSQSFPLWPDKTPGTFGVRPEDIPSITLYPPTVQPNGAAMLVYPGGGYEALMDYEGEAYAQWLAGQGYYGFVVNYRLTTAGYSLPVIFQDGVRALRWVRSRADELGIVSTRIGVIGSSAGGHLCALLAVNWDRGNPDAADPVDRASSRPDLAVLCYAPLRKMGEGFGRRMFAGRVPTAEEAHFYSPIENVTRDTPPCFLFHTMGDRAVPAGDSLSFAAALAQAMVPYEIHVYERGPHGLALGNGHPWTVECLRWLKERFVA